MFDFIQNWFTRPVETKPDYSIPEPEAARIIDENRQSLGMIENWIDSEAFQRSCFQYGVPDFIRDAINQPVGPDQTYTDLMVFLSRKHFAELNYLEIGVSVGKNFFQMLRAHSKGRFTGFDIEEINPVLESQLQFLNREEWNTPSRSIKKGSSSMKCYQFANSTVRYMSADVWDENSWARLKGQKFNMVFSDALHTPKAILFEFEMLVKYDLLDSQFIIFWDDLVGKMKNSFYRIIRKYDRQYQVKDIYLLSINGWIGQNEGPHTVGVISNFNL